MEGEFKILANSQEEEALQFSEEMKLRDDLKKLKDFYAEVRNDKDPVLRRYRSHCRLKIRKIEADLAKYHKSFTW